MVLDFIPPTFAEGKQRYGGVKATAEEGLILFVVLTKPTIVYKVLTHCALSSYIKVL